MSSTNTPSAPKPKSDHQVPNGAIAVSGRTIILEKDLREEFIRASGPGGQNVNKVSTAVQLWFDLSSSQTLSAPVKERAAKLAGSRLTQGGEILIQADRFRTRERNRQDAVERLLDLLRRALVQPKTRRPTRPTLGSKKRRLDTKKKRGETKKMRSGPVGD